MLISSALETNRNLNGSEKQRRENIKLLLDAVE